MKWMQTIALTVAAAGLFSVPEEKPVRVGTFDSRALAVAYTPSAHFKAWLAEVRERNDEKAGLARQALMHKQGFSTMPVDDILAVIADDLPGVAEKAGVDVIVSKWRIAYMRDDVEFVDVTDLLVQLFEPDERVLKTVKEMKDVAPLPLFETDWEAMGKSH